jgi:molecular chaperone GrpE
MNMENEENPLENKEMEAANAGITDSDALEKEGTENQESDKLASEETNIQSEIEKARAEAAEWKDKYVRLYAEFENFRSRTSREKIAMVGTASEGLMKDLLPVIDDFERSLKAMETSDEVSSLKEGVDLVFHKFTGLLHQKGLKAMETIGKPFDADFHEAITQFPAPDPSQKGMVIDELDKGYSLNDKTIRFARVIIGA